VKLFWPPALSSLSQNDKQTAVCFCLHKTYLYGSDIWRRVVAEGEGENVAFGLNPWDPVRFAGVSVVNRNLGGK
jgi:hypothetical protein